MHYTFDNAVWTDDIKIIAGDTLIIPGMEMFGHNCSTRHLSVLSAHIHKTAEFLYLSNGSQRYHIHDEEYVIKGNQLLVVAADVPHSTGPNAFGRHESLWFRLDIDVFAQSMGVSEQAKRLLCARLHRMENTIISPHRNLYNDLQSAFYELSSADLTDRLCGYARFMQFITELIKCTDPSGAFSPSIHRVIAYIDENICSHLRLEELAELSGLSLSGFKQKFRRETGITPREYINLLKIEKAKELLLNGSSITETAFALDFSSSSYFSYLFRRIESMTPSAFLKKNAPALPSENARI